MWPIRVRDAAAGRVPAARANVPDGERRDGSPEPEPADHAAASPAATRWLRERRPLAAGHPADEAGTERRQRPGPLSGTATIAEPHEPKHQENSEQLACQSPIPSANQQCGYDESIA